MRSSFCLFVLWSCVACAPAALETDLDLFDRAFIGFVEGGTGGIGVELTRSGFGGEGEDCAVLSDDVHGSLNGATMEFFGGGVIGPRLGLVGGNAEVLGTPGIVGPFCARPFLMADEVTAPNDGNNDILIVDERDQELLIEVAHLHDLSVGSHRLSFPETTVAPGSDLAVEIPEGFEPADSASASRSTSELLREPSIDSRIVHVPMPFGAGRYDVEVVMLATPLVMRCDGNAACIVTEMVRVVWSGVVVVE